MTTLYAYIDGASKGNPGDAGIGGILQNDAERFYTEFSEAIGVATNNEAEYRALLRCLDIAHGLGATRLHIHSDSQLMVCQMTGQYAVRHPGLRPLFTEARARVRGFEQVEFQYISRSLNTSADALASAAVIESRKSQKSRQEE